MERQKIVYKKLSEIKPYKNNARKHDKKQIEQLANSIEKLGFRGVILIDKNNTVIAGHGRCLAAKKAGLKEIPCIYVDDLSEDQIKALRLIDNKVAEASEWDFDLVDIELESISDLNFDMSDFGFDDLYEPKVTKKKVEFEAIQSSEKIKTEHKCPRCGYEW